MKNLNLVKSNSEARRLIEQGGVSIEGEKVEDRDKVVTLEDFVEDKILIKKGKKVYHKVTLK